MQTGAGKSLVTQGAAALLYTPTKLLTSRMREIQAQKNNLTRPTPRAKDYATKTSHQLRNNEKKTSKSSTMLSNNRKGFKLCKTYVLQHRVLHGTFHKNEIMYVSEHTLALC